MGRDLIDLGLTAGITFKKILEQSYEAQLDQEFFTKSEANAWLKSHLVIAL